MYAGDCAGRHRSWVSRHRVTDALCSSADETHDAVITVYHHRYGQQVETVTVGLLVDEWRDRSIDRTSATLYLRTTARAQSHFVSGIEISTPRLSSLSGNAVAVTTCVVAVC